MMELLIPVLLVIIAVLAVMLYRTRKAVSRLQQKMKDLVVQESALADAAQKHNSIARHDIKGVLNRIQALISLIRLSEGNLSKEQEEHLVMIEDQCKEGKKEVDRALPREE